MLLFKKKPQSEDLEALRDIEDDITESNFVPYACHWDPHTIVTKNGEVLQVIRISGMSPEQLARNEDADLRAAIREAIERYIPSTDYAIWIHTVRRKCNLQTGGEFKRDFAGYLNRFWNDRNDWEHQFTNEVYVTIVREGETIKLADPKGLVRGVIPRIDIRHHERVLDESRDKLHAVVGKMLSMLAPYGAKRQGIYLKDGTYYSEVASFLGKLISTLDMDTPLSNASLADSLTDYDVTFGFNALEARQKSTGKRRFGACLVLKEYREIPTEAAERLLQVPAEFIMSQCFTFIDSRRALKGYMYQKELFDISKSKGLSEKTGLQDILASNKGKSTDFGEHQLSLFLLSDSVKGLEAAVGSAVAALGGLGMIPMREDIKLEECYWAQLPANFSFIRRVRPINTARLGGFAYLSNVLTGRKNASHWGNAVTTLRTASRTPYFFNFHVKDNGHTMMVGPEDAGETVLMNFLLAESRKFGGKVFVFGQGRSSEIFLRGLGGVYHNPYPGADPRDYANLSLNPFSMDGTPENRTFLAYWMTTLAGSNDKTLLEACERAVTQIMDQPQQERCLRTCVAALGNENAAFASLFAPWTGHGEFAALFDHTEETLSLAENVCGFEMGDLMEHKPALAPVLSYLLYRINLTLDGTPAIIVLGEAWSLLERPLFPGRFTEWLDRLRTKNAMVIFTTEHVDAASRSPMTKALLPHIATQIYLPDEDMEAAYGEGFGLSDKEISYLTVMNSDDRHFLIKQEGAVVVAELNLSGMPDILAVLCATEPTLEAMDKAIAENGLVQAEWMPKFLEAI